MTSRKNPYPGFILLLIGGFLCFSIWAAVRAVDAKPQVTDADYYSKGLRYNATLVEKRAAAVLGWTVSTRFAGRTLEFLLRDKDGQPVRAAQGTLMMYLRSGASNMTFPLLEVEAGVYQVNLTENVTGEMTARLEFEQGGARLSKQLLLNL